MLVYVIITKKEGNLFLSGKLALFFALFFPMLAWGEVLSLDDALRATYTACVGIDDALLDLKKMAGINTAITGVGTGLGAGATVVGIIKYSTDEEAEQYEKLLEQLREIQAKSDAADTSVAEAEAFKKEFDLSYESAVKDIEKYQSELDRLNKKSKSLGNWRTGLLAGNTATNVAGAIIANKNRVDDSLQSQIDNCRLTVKNLSASITQARISGQNVDEAKTIYDACREFDYVDISKINTRGKGATISSIVGATTGLAGTVTSAVANTDATRNDNTVGGKQREKNLNTASNVLAGASTAASATATVFNATQIKAIKDVANVASNCTEVLK